MGIDMKKWLSANKESICIYPCSEDTLPLIRQLLRSWGTDSPCPCKGTEKAGFLRLSAPGGRSGSNTKRISSGRRSLPLFGPGTARSGFLFEPYGFAVPVSSGGASGYGGRLV